MECTILKVDEDYRILLPQSLLKRAGWTVGEEPLKGWLLVGGLGKFRLLSSAAFERDPGCRSLLATIAEIGQPTGSLIEFRDEASVVLGLRLEPVEITPRGPGWRLTLPRALAAIMQIRSKESSVALLLLQEQIEIWTLETLRASMTVPLSEFI
jgi:DNA-binding transcriptional regulator/RsmH inhibitor MraZ